MKAIFDQASAANPLHRTKAMLILFVTICICLPTANSYAQPESLLRSLVPFPQQAIILASSGVSITSGDECQIVIGDSPSLISQQIADSLLALLTDTFDLRNVRVVRLADQSGDIATFNIYLEDEIPGWDEVRLAWSNQFGSLALHEEGYFHLVAPRFVLLEGKDANGLMYGWQTMKRLLQQHPDGGVMEEGCVILDYPEFPDRILRTSSNFQVAANIPPLISLAQRAWSARMNKIAVNDVKFNRLDQVIAQYFVNVATFRAELDRLHLEVIPGVADFGYSEGMLWDNPNLAEGVPVRNARLVVEDGVGRLIPDPGMTLSNGDFENVQNNRFAGFTNQENAGVSVFDDQQVAHSGSHSVRMENFRQGNDAGNCRFQMMLDCEPFRNYYFSIWVRTRNYDADWGVQAIPFVWENGNLGQPLAYPEFGVGANEDWRKLEISFNSLNHQQIRLYFGVWGGRAGQVWFDEAELREIAFVNLLRREGCPLTITSSDGETVYQEGEDFEQLVDPMTGYIQWPGDFNVYHEPPELRVTGNQIQDGDTLLASFYHPILIYYGQVMACPSEDETYQWLDEDAHRISELWDPKSFFLGYDEIRVLNWDEACQSRGMTPGEILSNSVARCTSIYQDIVEDCPLYLWSDMFDPFHNAVDQYYLVNGSLAGAGEGLSDNVRVVVWRNAVNSFRYFADLGLDVVGSADCSNNADQALEMSEHLRSIPAEHRRGMMYTTWNNRYNFIEEASPSFWSHYPHVIAEQSLEVTRTIQFRRIWPDQYWDDPNFPHVDSVFYKIPGDSLFRGVQATYLGDNETCRADLNIDDATGYRYYILSYGPGGGNTSPPNAPENTYLVGDDWQEVPANPAETPDVFRLLGASPNPFNSRSVLRYELPSAGDVAITVADLTGRNVFTSIVKGVNGSNQFLIDADKLVSGIYIVRVRWQDQTATQRITLVR